MAVTPLAVADTVLAGTVDSTSHGFTITNNNPFAAPLNYSIAEQPNAPWLTASPPTGTINGGLSNSIGLRVDFSGVTPGTYATNLVVSGNDPANASDTVNVTFVVNAAPVIGVNPDSFFYAISGGDSITGSVTIRNTGLGPLTYTSTVEGGYAGETEDNVGNSSLTLATSSALMRGGVVQVTSTVQLLEIRAWLNITVSRELRYIVYENTSGTSFSKIFETTVASSGTGTQWYSSGPVNIVLESGKRYAIGVNWPALAGLSYFWQASAPVPVPISFGTLTGGLAQSIFPPPATITQGATSSLYYTQLVTASGRWLTVESGASGTVAPGDSTLLGFKATTNLIPVGAASASLLIDNNDPVTGQVTIPVVVDVLTGVTEQEPGLPEEYALNQNFPNPFNPVTYIKFALPQESAVRLNVYNMLGQKVITLIDGHQSAGYFTVQWNGRNNSGRSVASGVYFYRLEATATAGSASFNSLKKMILLK